MKQKPELLAPAGNFEKLRAAVLYGADAGLSCGRRIRHARGGREFYR